MTAPIPWPAEVASEVIWGRRKAADVPDTDEWLGPEERVVQAGLRFEKRRMDWRLGRWTAKQVILRWGGLEAAQPEAVQILAAADGAPDVYLYGRRFAGGLSITHRAQTAVVALAPVPIGCDLERIEPRSDGLIADFFTADEAAYVAEEDRERRAALVWSSKESALKVLREGLRRDTRQIEVRHIEARAGFVGTTRGLGCAGQAAAAQVVDRVG